MAKAGEKAEIPEGGFSAELQLEAWLQNQESELAGVLAWRAAARVTPLLVDVEASALLKAFRGLAYARCFSLWPEEVRSRNDAPSLISIGHPPPPLSAVDFAFLATVFHESATDRAVRAVSASLASCGEMAGAMLWKQLTYDARLSRRLAARELAERPIWLKDGDGKAIEPPSWIEAEWYLLVQLLDGFPTEELWTVWRVWYENLLYGRMKKLNDPAIELSRLFGRDNIFPITDDDWKAGPSVVNLKIRQVLDWFEGQQNTETADIAKAVDAKPAEPEPGPGPNYAAVDGKLDVVASLPQLDEVAAQQALHGRLKAKVEKLTGALASVRNQYPELADAVEEYADLVAVDTTDLDVTGVWSVGGALAEFVSAYRNQNTSATMAVPLEPQLAASLSSITRDHGAFILGFAEGRELVERADDFALKRELLQELQTYGQPVLEMLASNRALVSHKARQLHKTLLDATSEFGWASSRLGYTAYVTVRKAVFAMIRHSVGEGRSLADIVAYLGGASVLLGDPNGEFIRAALPVLRDHGAQLLAFFNHSPEFRAWVEWALKIVNSIEHRRGRD
jgi:hypothetical protein